MRVLHFWKHAPSSVGGIETMIDQLSRGLASEGVEVDVLHLAPRPVGPVREVVPGYRVHPVPRDLEVASTSFSLASLRQFERLARDATVIHHHFPWPFSDLVHFLARAPRPAVLTYHSDIIRQRFLRHLYRPLRDRFIADMSAIVATSPNYLATSEVLRPMAGRVEVVPIGLDRAAYPPSDSARAAAWRARLGGRFFLFVGALRYYKGLHILIEAALGLPCAIAIVGAGEIERDLKARARRLGAENVHFLGLQSSADKVALLEACTGVVFPSHLRAEAFGVTLLEGAMFGKPLVSSEIGTGTSFVNVDGSTGVVVPPGDPAALRAALDFLLAHPAEAGRMGQNARERYQGLFTARRMAAGYRAIYERVAAKFT